MSSHLIDWLNDAGAAWAQHQITLAWQFLILVLLAGAVSLLWRRAPASFRSGLWLLALTRLLLPADLSLPTGLGSWGRGMMAPVSEASRELVPAAAVAGSPAVGMPIIGPQITSTRAASISGAPTANEAHRLKLTGALLALWLSGVTLLLTALLIRLIRLRRLTARADRVLPGWLETLAGEAARGAGLRRPVPLRVSEEISSPFVAGPLRPVIVLPRDGLKALSREEMHAVLLHECAHVRRRDGLANWLQVVVETLHFHNPLVWLATRLARLERELACDAAVLAHQPDRGREAYLDAMMKVIRLAKGRRATPLGAPALSEFHHTRRRFAQIMDAERPLRARMTWPMGAVLVVTALVLWPLAAPQVRSEQEPGGSVRSTAGGSLDTPISITMPSEGVPLSVFMGNLKTFTDLSFVIADGVDITVTASFTETPLREVLDAVTSANGLTWSTEDSTIVIRPAPGPMEGPPPTLSELVGTWRFDNSMGDDEQLSIFADGSAKVFYGNGHVDESQIDIGQIRVPEYGEGMRMRFRTLGMDGRLVAMTFHADHPAVERAKVWRRISDQPLVECVIFDAQGNELTDSGLQVGAAARTAPVAPAPPPPPPSGPPMIVATDPPQGAGDVAPSVTEITVTFDQDMSTTSWSWTGGGPLYPETTGRPHYRDQRTCVLPVRLEPGRFYRVGINSKSHQNFRSAGGRPTPPRAIWFCTEGAPEEELAFLEPPRPIEIVPAPDSTDVDPDLSEIRIVFDQPMSGGRSVTGGGDTFPPIPEGGQFAWSEDRKTFSFPVSLEPNHEYYFGINSFSHVNFQSDHGVPAPWTRVPFWTGERREE